MDGHGQNGPGTIRNGHFTFSSKNGPRKKKHCGTFLNGTAYKFGAHFILLLKKKPPWDTQILQGTTSFISESCLQKLIRLCNEIVALPLHHRFLYRYMGCVDGNATISLNYFDFFGFLK
jgi:hypothetical protein